METPTENAPKLSRKRKLVFSLVMLLGFVLLSEAGLRLAGLPTGRVRSISRLWNTNRQTFEQSIGVFTPGVRSKVSWPAELAYTVSVNSLGLRGRELPIDKGPAFRILALGDSYTFGFYVDDEETFPHQLEAMLAGRSQPIEVVNAGCGRYCLADELDFYRERARQLQPDLVVLVFCGNDVMDLMRDEFVYERQKRELAAPNLPKELWERTAWFEASLMATLAIRKWRSGVEHDAVIPIHLEPHYERAPLWQRYRELLIELRDACEADGCALVATWYPDAAIVRELVDDPLFEDFEKVCAEVEVPCFSALEKFRAADDAPGKLWHEPIDFHGTAEGNRLLAEEARGFLETGKWLPQ